MTSSTRRRIQPPSAHESLRGSGWRLGDALLTFLAGTIGVALVVQVLVAIVVALAPVAAFAIVIAAALLVALVLLAAHMLL